LPGFGNEGGLLFPKIGRASEWHEEGNGKRMDAMGDLFHISQILLPFND
jgi:hypothetical protein